MSLSLIFSLHHEFKVPKNIQDKLLDPPPLPAKLHPPLDWQPFLPISPYVYVVMLSIQGWANVQDHLTGWCILNGNRDPRKTHNFKLVSAAQGSGYSSAIC